MSFFWNDNWGTGLLRDLFLGCGDISPELLGPSVLPFLVPFVFCFWSVTVDIRRVAFLRNGKAKASLRKEIMLEIYWGSVDREYCMQYLIFYCLTGNKKRAVCGCQNCVKDEQTKWARKVNLALHCDVDMEVTLSEICNSEICNCIFQIKWLLFRGKGDIFSSFSCAFWAGERQCEVGCQVGCQEGVVLVPQMFPESETIFIDMLPCSARNGQCMWMYKSLFGFRFVDTRTAGLHKKAEHWPLFPS